MSSSPSVSAARPDTEPGGVAALVAATPPSRDRYVDFLRGLAIAFVAIGHWLVVVPSYDAGRFDGVNALGTVPVMRWLSWVFQVMPLFFIVGGFANALSWRSARRREQSWTTWVRGRAARLLRPTGVFLAVWVVVGVLARQVGIVPCLVHTMAWLVVVPLWFLAVYVVVVALAPPMLRLHERLGLVVPVLLVVCALVVDVARIHLSLEPVAYLNFLFVFLFCQQLGFFWLEGRLATRRWWPPAMLGGGITTLWLLTHVGPYPLSMVGVPGERVANNAPPSAGLGLGHRRQRPRHDDPPLALHRARDRGGRRPAPARGAGVRGRVGRVVAGSGRGASHPVRPPARARPRLRSPRTPPRPDGRPEPGSARPRHRGHDRRGAVPVDGLHARHRRRAEHRGRAGRPAALVDRAARCGRRPAPRGRRPWAIVSRR
jgi:hypothetical protein